MADKSNFTPDEWKVLLQGVIASGIAITAAEPSGLWGLLKRASPAVRPWRRRKPIQEPTGLSRQ